MPRKQVKSKGAVILKNLIKSMNDLERENGNIKGVIKLKSSADFTDYRTLTTKFPDAAKVAHGKALAIVANELYIAFGLAMEAPVWQWDFGDGDIIDTGDLRDSLNIVVTPEGLQVIYTEEYAAYVYYGAYINPYGNPNVKIYMPPRPWIKAVLMGGGPVEKFDLTGTYRRNFEVFMKQQLPDVKF